MLRFNSESPPADQKTLATYLHVVCCTLVIVAVTLLPHCAVARPNDPYCHTVDLIDTGCVLEQCLENRRKLSLRGDIHQPLLDVRVNVDELCGLQTTDFRKFCSRNFISVSQKGVGPYMYPSNNYYPVYGH